MRCGRVDRWRFIQPESPRERRRWSPRWLAVLGSVLRVHLASIVVRLRIISNDRNSDASALSGVHGHLSVSLCWLGSEHSFGVEESALPGWHPATKLASVEVGARPLRLVGKRHPLFPH